MTPGRDIDELCSPLIHEPSALSLAFRVCGSIGGRLAVPFLNPARPAAKKAIRLKVRAGEEGRKLPSELPRLCSVMCNFLFPAIPAINNRRGLDEPPFVGESYASA
jgi:hypothetical protein